MKKAVWVTWEDQRRNKSLSKALGVKLYQFDIKTHRFLRYPILLIKTVTTFIKTRPDYIFSQNPSIVLALFSVLYGKITNTKIIIDAHNAGVYPFEGRSVWANKLVHYIFKQAFLTIVTNINLKLYVEKNGGRAFVLPDPFPEIIKNNSYRISENTINFLLICTWAVDEPYEEVINAFRQLKNDKHLYITGNSRGREQLVDGGIPPNVTLTGYITNEEFDSLLTSCDCVIDLTKRDDCLVCGAYEAISAGKPLILSDTNTLRKYFTDSSVYTRNDVHSIKNAINYVGNNLENEQANVKKYLIKQEKAWLTMKDNLLSSLHNKH